MLTPVDEEIIGAIARSLHISAYADAVESGTIHRIKGEKLGWEVQEHEPGEFYLYAPEENDSDKCFKSEEAAWKAADIEVDRPRDGGDWADYAPPVSKAAELAAAELAGQIHQINGKSLMFLAREAAKADGLDPDDLENLSDTGRSRMSYLERFGHCIAHQALRSGVRWEDDHAKVTWVERKIGAPESDPGVEKSMTIPPIEFYPDWSEPKEAVTLAAPSLASGGIESTTPVQHVR